MRLEPAVFRSAVIAVFAFLSSAGVGWATEEKAGLIAGAVAAVAALLSGIAIRPAVTPNDKVVVYVENPDARTPVIKAGEATVAESRNDEVLVAARRSA